MPEIDILHIYKWTGPTVSGEPMPPSYSAVTPDGSLAHSDDPTFSVEDLVALGAEYGVTRWAERGDTLPDLDSEIVLVGWADAPITRDDVDKHYEHGNTAHPAVNIKVYDTDLPTGEAFADVVSEFELDPKLAALSPDELRSLIDAFLEAHGDVFWEVCRQNFEQLKEDAEAGVFAGRGIKVWSEGRQGGWAVVHGLPEIESWDAVLFNEWHSFTEIAKALVADIPRSMAWFVLANMQDALAGRVVRVQLTMVLADADLERDDNTPEAVVNWDWHTLLDLSPESTVHVTKM